MSNTIIEKLARNHPEDSVSDVLCIIFNEDKDFARKFLKKIHKLKYFEIISIIRNYSLSTGKKPDITFVVKKKGKNRLNYFHIETKITATENRRGKYKQYKHYTDHMKNNFQVWRKKCILLCPSTEYRHEEKYVLRYDFCDLIDFMNNHEFDANNQIISDMLVDYIKKKVEYSVQVIFKGAKQPLKQKRWEEYANFISELRQIMLDIKNSTIKTSTGGLWQRGSSCYYWNVGFRKKRSKKYNKGFLSYEFYTEDECRSPLYLYYAQDILGYRQIKCPQYDGGKIYYSKVFDDLKSLSILEDYSLGSNESEIKKRLIIFAKKASRKKMLDIIYKGNKYFRSIIMYIDLIDNKLDPKKYSTEFSNECSGKDIIYRLQIKNINNSKYFSIAFEPTNPDPEALLRWESDFEIKNYIEDKNKQRFIMPIGQKIPELKRVTKLVEKSLG